MNNLTIVPNQMIKSTELVELINEFRKIEGNKSILLHKNFMAKIEKEIEVLKKLDIDNGLNFKLVNYRDAKGESRPCFELNRDGMLQMLNSESAYVRYKTIEYINKLEDKLKDSYIIQNPIERAKRWIEEQEEKQALLLENKQKDQIIGELKTKADYTDVILKNKGLVTITQIAKDYGMSGNEMNKKLHELGIQYKQSGQWLLYSKHHNKGYTHSETVNYKHSDGRADVKMNTKWTQKGRLFLYDLLKEHGTLPLIEKDIEGVI